MEALNDFGPQCSACFDLLPCRLVRGMAGLAGHDPRHPDGGPGAALSACRREMETCTAKVRDPCVDPTRLKMMN